MTFDTKKILALAALIAACTQIGNGVKGVQYLLGIGEAAYAGQATAQKVDTEFKQYLKTQEDSTKAIQGYIAQQQQQHSVPPPVIVAPATEEVSDDGEVKEMQWTDKHGKKHHECCQGTTCWPWHKTTLCEHPPSP